MERGKEWRPQTQIPRRKRGRPSKADIGARARKVAAHQAEAAYAVPQQVGGAAPEAQLQELDVARLKWPIGDGLLLACWCGQTYVYARLEMEYGNRTFCNVTMTAKKIGLFLIEICVFVTSKYVFSPLKYVMVTAQNVSLPHDRPHR